MSLRKHLLIAVCAMALPTCAAANDFNSYISKSVNYLLQHHSGGGYDINSVFTHDIDYGPGVIKASSPTKTMCVAAVAEVIITAIKIYAQETGDITVFDKVPITAWTKGNATSLRANIFMFDGTGSRGTGHTLSEYQLGQQLQLQDLKAGDFINLNRTNKTGHAVVFLNFLHKGLEDSPVFDPNTVVGFRYFSAQGGKDNGFAYRNAFFDGNCPTTSDIRRDCNIIRSNNPVLLNLGRLWDPSRWAYNAAVDKRKAGTRAALENALPYATRGGIDALLEQALNRELQWNPEQAKSFANDLSD